MKKLSEPVVASAPAAAPSATLPSPVSFAPKACSPSAVFSLPVIFDVSAKRPGVVGGADGVDEERRTADCCAPTAGGRRAQRIGADGRVRAADGMAASALWSFAVLKLPAEARGETGQRGVSRRGVPGAAGRERAGIQPEERVLDAAVVKEAHLASALVPNG